MSGGHGGGGGGAEESKKTIAVICVSIAMLIAMIVAVVIGVKNTRQDTYVDDETFHSENPNVASSNKAVNSLCQLTDYRKMCERTLSHSNSSDPKQLIQAGFHAAIEQTEFALNNSTTMVHAAQDDTRTSGAMETCKEAIEYALTDLQKSVNTMDRFDLSELGQFADGLRVWLSGALTFHETCFDAFENTTGDSGEKMKKLFSASKELTSNGLVMATELSVMLGVGKDDLPEMKDTPRHLGETKDSHHEEPKEAAPKEATPPHEEAKPPKEELSPYWVDIGKRKLILSPPRLIKADVVVAKDGGGKYKTITEALNDVPVKDPVDVASSDGKPFLIYIKQGIYEEEVRVEANMMNVMFVGDGPDKTIITKNKNFADGLVVYKTATVSILGSNFIARDICFENSSPPEKHQAVALLVQSDMSIFYNCHVNGTRSTLFAHSHRQFYRQCTISGTVDFIFGDAAAVFQNCHLVIKKPLDQEQCHVAAQGRLNQKANTGFVLQNCTFTADALYYPVRQKNKAYFGRPWKKYSRTVIMQSFIDDSIDPQGWAPWMGDSGIDTCFLAEFENRGPGSATSGRVKWPGVRVNISAVEVEEFTPGKFLGADKWLVPSLVPYDPTMVKSLDSKNGENNRVVSNH